MLGMMIIVKKRVVSLILAVLFIAALFPCAALAEFKPDEITTKHVVLMDAETGNVLWEKAGYDKAYPASTTKIMTAIIALETLNLDEEVTLGSKVESKGSKMGLVRGETLTVRDLLYGTMLVSGNDACRALAEHMSGSIEEFAVLMNAKAQELGMTGTHFVTPNGLHDEEHYTTAYDMALLTRYAMQNADFRKIVGSKTYQVPATNKDSDGYLLENSNKLLYTKEKEREKGEIYEYKYAIGVKTGDTVNAGRCLVAAAEKDGVELITVQYGDFEDEVSAYYRFEKAAELFNWGFENSVSIDVTTLDIQKTVDQLVNNASFEDENNGMVTLEAKLDGIKISGLRADMDDIIANAASITMTPTLGMKLTAPVKKGDVVGTAVYQYNGHALFTADLVATRDVNEMGSAVISPSASPLITESQMPEKQESSLLFWILVVVGLLAVVVVIKLLQSRKRRRRRRRSRTLRRR